MGFEPNQNQEDVINYGEGTLLVEAGPGSGKTTVIVARIEELIKREVNPESFLVITFTRKAAENLKEKLRKSEKIPNNYVSKMQISTIHSFCLEYLKSKNIHINLLDDDTSEKKELFIKKYKEELGFVGEYTILDFHMASVIDKFGEYTSFKVDTPELIKYFEKNKPISQDYIDFVNGMDFFSKQRIDDSVKEDEKREEDDKKNYKDNWYYARCLQIARAYPIYLKLLDKFDYVDYDTLQLKALEELKVDSITQYTTVFVDEFQDTDPLQFRIFKILEDKSKYFTAVGDVDQHIYAFRSSFADYFEEMIESSKKSPEIISLDVNYRSTENIVKITDDFIKGQRKEYSKKHLKSDDKLTYNNPNFIIRSKKNNEEADKIYETIKYLKDVYNLKDSDFAILYRTNYNSTVTKLIEKFDADSDIDYSIKGRSDLDKNDEVKSLLTLLWYITRKTHYGHILTSGELDELNLKAFCGEYFKPTFWSLSKSTISYLTELDNSFRQDVINVENKFRGVDDQVTVEDFSKIKKNEKMDDLIEIFKQVKIPIVDVSKIDNENDKRFFIKLHQLREKIEKEEHKSIFEIYYELISLGDIFDNFDENSKKIHNLAILTQTIFNYESFISATDVRGLFYFLRGVVRNYSSYYKEDPGINLMTVHAAKGLEFTVVFVISLENKKFPMALKDEKREKNYVYPSYTHYTPTECLKYKKDAFDKENKENLSYIDYENKLDLEEEDRILYVAMTRAADLLILSTLKKEPEQIEKILPQLTELNIDNLDKITFGKFFKHHGDEKLKLNYSSYSSYKSCPFKYNLGYNFGFRRSPSHAANRGTVFHKIMETVNNEFLKNREVSISDLEKITKDIYDFMFHDGDKSEFENFNRKVKEYHEKYSLNREVLGSELDFELDFGNYILNGSIDLIYKINDDEIAILDYKYAVHDDKKIENYKKQLYIYALALKQLPEFKDYTIKKAITHFVVDDYQHKVDITDDVLENQLNDLNDVACKINCNKYPKIDFKDCGRCNYRIICQK